MKKKILFIVIIIIGFILLAYAYDPWFDNLMRTYYWLFPITIEIDLPGGESWSMATVHPLSKIKADKDTFCTIGLRHRHISNKGWARNGKMPKGLIIYDKNMNRLGYIKWGKVEYRGKGLPYMDAFVSAKCLKNPHKAVFDY